MSDSFHVVRVADQATFQRYQSGIQAVLSHYEAVLTDDFSNPRLLLQNTATYIPFLWLSTDAHDNVCGLAALADILPGQYAYLHGVSYPVLRHTHAINDVVQAAFDVAFKPPLSLVKIKAEFDADNRGAKGFCLRMGFVKEAHFKRDTRVNGEPRDVAVYSLFAEDFWRRENRREAKPHA